VAITEVCGLHTLFVIFLSDCHAIARNDNKKYKQRKLGVTGLCFVFKKFRPLISDIRPPTLTRSLSYPLALYTSYHLV
jgi:hypothetical protein